MSHERTPESRPLREHTEDCAEHLSTQALAIEFVGRRRELEAALGHLQPDDALEHGKGLIVHGDSGTGKTFFAQELMRRFDEGTPRALCLYVDVANDEYQSSRTISALLKMSLIAGPMTRASPISVPEALSLQRYRRQTRQRGVGRGLLRAIAHAISSVIGVGSAVSEVLDTGKGDDASLIEDELAAYLAWVAKREIAFLTIDNLQFLNLDVRLTIESVLQRIDKNIRFVGASPGARTVVQHAIGGWSAGC